MKSSRWIRACLLLILIHSTASALAEDAHADETRPAATIMPGMGNVHHPVSTRNVEAQQYFDQGLALCYGFNHDEAARSFHRAAELDAYMAMAWWGLALAVGPNYNLPVDKERELEAYRHIQKALQLSEHGPQVERAYIEALAKRYTDKPTTDYLKLEEVYHAAMGDVSRKFPDDLDAATLFAESGMNLRPWKLWNADGTPAPGTEEIVATLESVLKRDPNHLGANHYYIHAVEGSSHPERALPSADRLAALAPAEGHLVHMPAHIFIRTGDHEAAERTNEAAVAADDKYIAATHAEGIYPMMYYTHNLHFIAVENATMGRYKEALDAARRVREHVEPHVFEMPMLDSAMPLPTLVMVRFQRWDEILKLPQPDAKLPMSTGVWHYARGLAFAGRQQIEEAQRELDELQKIAPEMAKIPTNSQGPRNAGIITKIAAQVIEAKVAEARKQPAAELQHLREAVDLQDTLDYTEPPDWFFPVREALGAALLQEGKAAEAEKVFRRDLEWNPRNPRSLFGLMQSVKAQGMTDDAAAVQMQFAAAWKGPAALQMADLWSEVGEKTAAEAAK